MAITGVNHVWFLLFILISIFAISRSEVSVPRCEYTIYVKTGSRLFAGTDSIISLSMYDAASYGFRIDDLVKWGGKMGPDHNYFEAGNLDKFSGSGPCLRGPVCSITLVSDGSGNLPAWYCKYVEVITSWPHIGITRQKFTVNQWLATILPPYKLTATINNCGKLGGLGDYSQSSPAMEM